MVQAPIFHVNGDDPEACARVARLAFAFRQEFHKDVVIDMVCYRRYGHNEQDDPSLTQPLLYQLIKEHRSVRKLYTEALVRRGDITLDEAEAALADFSRRLQEALDETRASAPPRLTSLPAPAAPARASRGAYSRGGGPAGHGGGRSYEDARGFHASPEDRPLARSSHQAVGCRGRSTGHLERRSLTGRSSSTGETCDCAAKIRDRGRSVTAMPFTSTTGPGASSSRWQIWPQQAPRAPAASSFTIRCLSEYAALGFEYGYSLFSPEALVAWEAQFGDFVNGAR